MLNVTKDRPDPLAHGWKRSEWDLGVLRGEEVVMETYAFEAGDLKLSVFTQAERGPEGEVLEGARTEERGWFWNLSRVSDGRLLVDGPEKVEGGLRAAAAAAYEAAETYLRVEYEKTSSLLRAALRPPARPEPAASESRG